MGTRANIVIKDNDSQLIFYRHYDGYPEHTLPILQELVDWVKVGRLRNNVSQFAGWLIVRGAIENEAIKTLSEDDFFPNDWKVGTFEPTTSIHGDIEYLYTIDLKKLSVTFIKV
jgi:hypothetical protein